MATRPVLRIGVVCGVIASSCIVQAQDHPSEGLTPIHVLFEQFTAADRTSHGATTRENFFQGSLNLSQKVQLVGGYSQQGDDKWLDETYFKLDQGAAVIRAGRFRSAFGLSTWSDLHYTPFIALPLIRSYDSYIGPDTSLYRLDRGVDVSGGNAAIQWQAAFVDSSDDDWSIAPKNLDSAVARLQFSQGPLIVGLSGFGKTRGEEASQKKLLGVDLRWTAPRVIVRAEAVTGFSNEEGGSGYYADVFYRPPHLARTQLGARFEGVRLLDTGSRGHLFTLGARQFLTPNLALNLNYGWGSDIPEAAGTRGPSVQLLTSFRF